MTDKPVNMSDPAIRAIISEINAEHHSVLTRVQQWRADVIAGKITSAASGALIGALMRDHARDMHDRFGERLRKHDIDMPMLG